MKRSTHTSLQQLFCSLARFRWEIRTSQLMHQARLGFNHITGKYTWDQQKKHFHTHTQEVHKFYFALAQVFGEKSTHPNNITGTHARDQPKEEIHIHMTYASLLCSLARFWWKIHTSHQKSAANKLMQLPSLRLTSDSTISQVKHTWHQPKLAFSTHTWITPINYALLPDFGEKLIHPTELKDQKRMQLQVSPRLQIQQHHM